MFFKCLLSPLLPFLLALALSAMVEPTVQKLRRGMGVRRSFAAALVTTALLLVAGGGVALVLVRLGIELRAWSARLPEVVEGSRPCGTGCWTGWGPGTRPARPFCARPWTRRRPS